MQQFIEERLLIDTKKMYHIAMEARKRKSRSIQAFWLSPVI